MGQESGVVRHARGGSDIQGQRDVAAAVTKDMAKAGVGILAGCDTMIAGFCVHDELEAMVRGGMTPLAALQTATVNPARYFGLEQTAGTVAPGHAAIWCCSTRIP